MTENSPTDPSVPAAPVEVEGERVEHDEWCESEFIHGPMAYSPFDCANRNELRRRGFAVTKNPALSAALTTPDIADERVRLLKEVLFATCDQDFIDVRKKIRTHLLATPSTPGAGQADEIEAFRSWLADEAANGHGSRREGMALALRHLNDAIPEPAIGQGEPS